VSDDILFSVRGGVGHILLNRPEALNALTLEMCIAMNAQLAAWETDPAVAAVEIRGQGSRAFCAGGDIRRLYDERGGDYPRRFYWHEYRLDARVRRFSKPYAAILDGIVMGGGVGISINGGRRIATENTVFAMPETGIGLFPDVGGSHFLSRCPGALGMYLGLSGARLKAADMIYCGLADDGPSGEPSLARHRALIDRCFDRGSVEAIVAALGAEPDPFARETLAVLATKSPTSLKLAHRQIRRGARLGFDDCMRMEWRMINGVIAGHDFYEGTRAAIIDKDRQPRWHPATLADVADGDIERYFVKRPGDELRFDWEEP